MGRRNSAEANPAAPPVWQSAGPACARRRFPTSSLLVVATSFSRWGGRRVAGVAGPTLAFLAALCGFLVPGVARAATTATANLNAPGQYVFSVPLGVTSV